MVTVKWEGATPNVWYIYHENPLKLTLHVGKYPNPMDVKGLPSQLAPQKPCFWEKVFWDMKGLVLIVVSNVGDVNCCGVSR